MTGCLAPGPCSCCGTEGAEEKPGEGYYWPFATIFNADGRVKTRQGRILIGEKAWREAGSREPVLMVGNAFLTKEMLTGILAVMNGEKAPGWMEPLL